MTTTSPRAMTRPLTSRSTGSPAMRCRPTTEPGPSASASPSVIEVRPISTDTSTVTSTRRSSSPETAGPPGSAGSRGAKSMASDTGCLLLDGDVGEEDVVGLDVGLLGDLLENPPLELQAALAPDDLRAGDVGQRVGDDVAHDRLLRQRAIALRRRRARGLAAARRKLAGLEDERHVELDEASVGRVDQEVARQHVDLAVDLRLGRRRWL